MLLDQTRLPRERVDRRCAAVASSWSTRSGGWRSAARPRSGSPRRWGWRWRPSSGATTRPRCGGALAAARARLAGLPADGGQPGWALGDARGVIDERRGRRTSCGARWRRSPPHSRGRGRALPRDGRATAPSCSRRARGVLTHCNAGALATRRLRLGARRRARGACARPGPARLGRRDAAVAAGAAPDRLGAGRGRHPAHADRRRRRRAAVRARAGRRGRLRRRPDRAQRRCREQDRLVHALGARARPRRAVLRRRALVDDRPRDRERRGDPHRGARCRRGRRLAGHALAPAGTAVCESGLRRHAGRQHHGDRHRGGRAPRAVRAEPARRGA